MTCRIINIVLILCMVISLPALSQRDKKDKQQAFEEEIIRYLGYEEIPVRYLSLPYDVTMSHNVERNFMDIGYLLLMFVPLVFLWRVRRWQWRIVLFILLGFMWIASLGSSHVLGPDGSKIFNKDQLLTEHISTLSDDIPRQLLAKVYHTARVIYEPIAQVLERASLGGDQYTYLILLAIIYLLYYLFEKYSSTKKEGFYLGALLLFYCFFMLILSAGIIWYGFLMFPLLYLEISKYARVSKLYRRYLFVAGGIFIGMAYFLKVSNLYLLSDKGLGMLQPPIMAYNFGGSKGNEIYEGYFRNIGPALEQINSENESLIYQAGTSLAFLIDKNNERVFKDGILNIHSQLVDKYKYKSKVNEALKASGFRYLIVSPNLYVVDQTPEKSLTAKFQKMLGYLHQNVGLRLLATDRVVRKTAENGQVISDYDMFGDEIIQNGSYAIYEIL